MTVGDMKDFYLRFGDLLPVRVDGADLDKTIV